MRLFAKITFIFNLCFLLVIPLRLYELGQKASAAKTAGEVGFNPFVSSLAVLGYSAIVVNVFFVLLSVWWLLSKRGFIQPKWIAIFNCLVFVVQVYYFFFSHH